MASIDFRPVCSNCNRIITEEVGVEYLDELFKRTQSGFNLSDTASNAFAQLDRHIQDTFKVAFGNRIMKQVKLFVPVYMACGFSEFDGLDYMLASKI